MTPQSTPKNRKHTIIAKQILIKLFILLNVRANDWFDIFNNLIDAYVKVTVIMRPYNYDNYVKKTTASVKMTLNANVKAIANEFNTIV